MPATDFDLAEFFGVEPYYVTLGTDIQTDWSNEIMRSARPYLVYHGGERSYRLVSHYIERIADRLTESRWRAKSFEEDARHYAVSVAEVFQVAREQYASISVDPGVMAGAPCLRGTRIPVYMLLDAVEYYGSLDGALRSYPSITMQQIKDAIGFAKIVVECPVEDKAASVA